MRTYDDKSWRWLCDYVWELAKKYGEPTGVTPDVIFRGGSKKAHKHAKVREKIVCDLRNNVLTKEYHDGKGGAVMTFSLAANIPDAVDADYRPISQPIIADLMGYDNHTTVTIILRKNGMSVRGNGSMDLNALAEIRAGRMDFDVDGNRI